MMNDSEIFLWPNNNCVFLGALEDFDKLGMKEVPTSTEKIKNDENEDSNALAADELWNSEFLT